MCGRYASTRTTAELAEEFGTARPDRELRASWNVAPTQQVWAVLERPRQSVTYTSVLEPVFAPVKMVSSTFSL